MEYGPPPRIPRISRPSGLRSLHYETMFTEVYRNPSRSTETYRRTSNSSLTGQPQSQQSNWIAQAKGWSGSTTITIRLTIPVLKDLSTDEIIKESTNA